MKIRKVICSILFAALFSLSFSNFAVNATTTSAATISVTTEEITTNGPAYDDDEVK